MARPTYGGSIPDQPQMGGYGQGNTGIPDYSQPHFTEQQWTASQNAQTYPQQWQHVAQQPTPPPQPSGPPPVQYNPSAFGPMPGAQRPTYQPPQPAFQHAQVSYVEQTPSTSQNPYPQDGRIPTRPNMNTIPSMYQAEAQQKPQGWSQNPTYSDNPPPPPPKQPTNVYPPPPPPKLQQLQQNPQTQTPFSPTSVYSGDSAAISSPITVNSEHTRPFPPTQPYSNLNASYAPESATPRPGSVPAWNAGSSAPARLATSTPTQQQLQYVQNADDPYGRHYSYSQSLGSSQPSSTYRPPSGMPSQAAAVDQFSRPPQVRPQEHSPEQHGEPVSPLQRQSVGSDRTEDARFSLSGDLSRTASMISRDSISASDILGSPPLSEKRPAMSPGVGAASASALGFGGPGDWEYYGAGPEEIDDTAMYGSKVGNTDVPETQATHVVELPSETSPSTAEVRPTDQQLTAHNDGKLPVDESRRSHEPSPRSTPVGFKPQPGQAAQQGHPPPAVQTPTMAVRQPQLQAQPIPQANDQVSPASTADGEHSQPKVESAPQSFIVNDSSSSVPQSFVVDDGSSSVPQSFAVDDSFVSVPVEQPQEQAPDPGRFIPVDQHNATVQELQQKLDSLQATINGHVKSVGILKQKLDETQKVADKEASNARKARNEITELQKQIVATNAAHAIAKDDLHHQKDRFQFKLTEAQTALSKAREQHGSEQEALQKKLNEAQAAAEAAQKSFDGERDGLKLQIHGNEEMITATKAEVDSLRTQLDEQKQKYHDLDKQLEEEKAKAAEAVAKAAEAVAKAAPALDPWFQGSLQRFEQALRAEASAPAVHDKLKVFIDFVNSESRLRGVDLPFGPSGEPKGFPQQPVSPPREPNPQPKVKSTPPDYVVVEPDQYSPGGRPVVHRASDSTSRPSSSDNKAAGSATSSTTIDAQRTFSEPSNTYKPYRREESVSSDRSGDPNAPQNGNRPAINNDQPAYKPFVYRPSAASISSPSVPKIKGEQRPVIRPAASAPSIPTLETSHAHEETHFEDTPQSTSSNLEFKDPFMIPQPLRPKTPTPQQPGQLHHGDSPAPAGVLGALGQLAAILPPAAPPAQATAPPQLAAIQKGLAGLAPDFSWIGQVTKAWERTASATRERLAKERRERLAAVEQHSNDLFDAGDIGYEDISVLEEQAKDDERDKEAREEKLEYDLYAAQVFGEVWARLDRETAALLELERAAAEAVEKGCAGRQALVRRDGDVVVDVGEAITTFLQVHQALESRYAKTGDAIRERDRKYKRSETKPLYAKGDIPAMKRLEKHFEVTEKRTDVKMKVETVERARVVWESVKKAVLKGLDQNKKFTNSLLSAVQSIKDDKNMDLSEQELKEKEELLRRAKQVLLDIENSSTLLMQHFDLVEMDLNDTEYEVSLASAKLEGAAADVFENLKKEKAAEDGRLKQESMGRLADIKLGREEGESLINDVLAMKAAAAP